MRLLRCKPACNTLVFVTYLQVCPLLGGSEREQPTPKSFGWPDAIRYRLLQAADVYHLQHSFILHHKKRQPVLFFTTTGATAYRMLLIEHHLSRIEAAPLTLAAQPCQLLFFSIERMSLTVTLDRRIGTQTEVQHLPFSQGE